MTTQLLITKIREILLEDSAKKSVKKSVKAPEPEIYHNPEPDPEELAIKNHPESDEFKDAFKLVPISKGIDGVIKNGFGWLSPRGEFFGFPTGNHLQAAMQLPVSPEIKKEGEEWLEIAKDSYKSAEISAEGGHAPEWHVYSMNRSRSQDILAKMLYKDRWIRIGRGPNLFEFEGTPEALKDKMSYIKKFENQLDPGITVRISPIKITS